MVFRVRFKSRKRSIRFNSTCRSTYWTQSTSSTRLFRNRQKQPVTPCGLIGSNSLKMQQSLQINRTQKCNTNLVTRLWEKTQSSSCHTKSLIWLYKTLRFRKKLIKSYVHRKNLEMRLRRLNIQKFCQGHIRSCSNSWLWMNPTRVKNNLNRREAQKCQLKSSRTLLNLRHILIRNVTPKFTLTFRMKWKPAMIFFKLTVNTYMLFDLCFACWNVYVLIQSM